MVDNQIKEYKHRKVVDYLNEEPKRVGFFFWHGLGDLLMFIRPFEKIKSMYLKTHFQLILQKGVGQEDIHPNAIFVDSDKELEEFSFFDYIFHIHFPMSEYDKIKQPKAEKCCIEELGIDPISGHWWDHNRSLWLDTLSSRSKFIGVSFQATALPGLAGVKDTMVAKLIWNEVLETGLIPIEIMMEHKYHNPVNRKFDFIDCTIRSVIPSLPTMINVIQNCFAFMGVSSGPIHLALSILHSNRVAYFENKFKLITITREPLVVFDVNNYKKGSVKEWLKTLS